jgi:hypothetical protein
MSESVSYSGLVVLHITTFLDYVLDNKFQVVIRGINSPALGMVNGKDIQQSKVIYEFCFRARTKGPYMKGERKKKDRLSAKIAGLEIQ